MCTRLTVLILLVLIKKRHLQSVGKGSQFSFYYSTPQTLKVSCYKFVLKNFHDLAI